MWWMGKWTGMKPFGWIGQANLTFHANNYFTQVQLFTCNLSALTTNLYIAKHRSQHNIRRSFNATLFHQLYPWNFQLSWVLQLDCNNLSICHMLWSARLLINVRITLGARYQSLLIGVQPLWINWGWATLGCQPHFDWTIWRSVRLAEAKTESVGRGGDGEAFSVRRQPVSSEFAPPILSTLTSRLQFWRQQFDKKESWLS